jgi:hypothetical protein
VITGVLQYSASGAAQHSRNWEIIDCAGATKRAHGPRRCPRPSDESPEDSRPATTAHDDSLNKLSTWLLGSTDCFGVRP